MGGQAGLGLTVHPAFLLLAAALYYLGGGPAVTALFTAALAHELGHLAALLWTGTGIRGLRLTVSSAAMSSAIRLAFALIF